MAPSADDGQRTRERLQAATVSIIAEQGWGAVTTRVVAERAGVGPSVVHYHYSSIDDLRRQAAVDTLARLIEPFLLAGAEMTPRELLLSAGAASVGEDVGPGSEVSNFIYEVMPAAVRDPELQGGLGRLLKDFRDLLADRIRACHPEARDRAEVLATLFAAAIDGLQLHLLVHPGLDLVAHLRPLLDLLGPEHVDTDQGAAR